MSLIDKLETQIVMRLKAALTAPGQPHPKVEVRAWPDRPQDYKMTHPHGCAMVVYKGSKFAQDGATAGQLVTFDAGFEIGLIARTLREPNTPGADAGDGIGMYDLLETCRTALVGWQPMGDGWGAANGIQLRSETFDDYMEGKWGYSLKVDVPMVTVVQCNADDELAPALQSIQFTAVDGGLGAMPSPFAPA